jgi:hypothetical protein
MKWRMFALANVEKSGAKPNASKFTTVVGWSVLKKDFFQNVLSYSWCCTFVQR